jgi:hypothetical protein
MNGRGYHTARQNKPKSLFLFLFSLGSPTLMTSSNSNYFPKGPPPNALAYKVGIKFPSGELSEDKFKA